MSVQGSSLMNGSIPPLYAVKKRKRPHKKADANEPKEPGKSNPSKRHRDRLNTELDQLSKLIPFPDEVLNKLDKLSILRLAMSYVRNKSYHANESNKDLSQIENDVQQIVTRNQQNQLAIFRETESTLALAAIHGFIIVVTQDFNIFYVTETVQNYLGFPQCDVMNLCMLDLIHAEDRDLFMRQMKINPQHASPTPPNEEDGPTMPEYMSYKLTPEMFRGLSQDGLLHRSFICRLRCLLDNSSGFLALHFTGHLRLVPGQNRKSDDKVSLPDEIGLFLLAAPLQSPSILEIRTKNFIFRTKHRLDYTPLGIDQKGRVVLGYTEQQLKQRSGYEFVHSADMMHCADAHTKLMRKGESGLTVFRLLHKDNKWVWVTASARLVFKNGHPDCIIATQRPIQDEEGEEHMKKRTNAFRFDFTGQAILYGDVNPIGTKGGPDKNVIDDPMSEPASKVPRITNGSSLDRKSLYGAQAMQRMDIYAGNLPYQASNIYAGTGKVFASTGAIEDISARQHQEELGPLTNESDITFYPLGTDIPQQHNPVDPAGQNSQSGIDYHMVSPNLYDSNPQLMQHMVGTQQSPMNGTTNPGYPLTNMSQQEPPRLYHPPSENGTSLPDIPNQIHQNPMQPQQILQNPMHPQQMQQNPMQQHQMQQNPMHPQQMQQSPMQQSPILSHQMQQSPMQQSPIQPHQMQQSPIQPHQMQQSPMQQHQIPMQSRQIQQNPMQQNQIQQSPIQRNPLKRPYPGFVAPETTQIRQQGHNLHRQHMTGKSMQNVNAKPEHSGSPQQQPFPNYGSSGVAGLQENDQATTHHIYFKSPNNSPPQQNVSNTQLHQDMVGATQPIQRFVQKENHHPSVIESLTINSLVKTNQTRPANSLNNMNPDLDLPIPDNWDVPEMIGYQNNTIQFDLQKVAADYQTTDPLSKVQEYLQNNPSHAMAIATGHVPEQGMPTLASDKVKAYTQSCHYQQTRNVPTELNPDQFVPSSSIGKNINNPFTNFSSSMPSDDDLSFLSPSLSSVNSMSSLNECENPSQLPFIQQ